MDFSGGNALLQSYWAADSETGLVVKRTLLRTLPLKALGCNVLVRALRAVQQLQWCCQIINISGK